MTTQTTSVLGVDIPVSGVPETAAEMVTAAGSEAAAVKIFNQQVIYHRTNSEARSAVVEALEKILSVERETEKVKSPTKADPNREIEKFAESEQEFVNRAVAASGRKLSDLIPEIQSAVGTLEFKAVGEPRISGPRKMAKVYTEGAQKLLDAGADKLANAVNLLQQANPGLTIPVDANNVPTLEGLAGALKTNRERVEKEANAALGLAG